MVFGFIKRVFKTTKRSYTVADDRCETSSDSVFFEEEKTPAVCQLVNAQPLSPLLWRYIFPGAPAHPSDCDEDSVVSRHSAARRSTTSSAGYGSQSSSDDGIPRLGAASMGSSGDSEEIEIFSSKETSPVLEVRFVRGSGNGETPSNYVDTPSTPATLPPKTPHRSSFARLEMRKKGLAHYERIDFEIVQPKESSSESAKTVTWCEQTTVDAMKTPHMGQPESVDTPYYGLDPFTPATLSPKTMIRGSLMRQGLRVKYERLQLHSPTSSSSCSYSSSDGDPSKTASQEAAESSSAKVGSSIWGEPLYSPASVDNMMSSSSSPAQSHDCSPFYSPFVRHDNRKMSLHRKPSATVSGRVKQMVKFFENDSERVEIPRRLDRVPCEFMRSAPQMNGIRTPTSANSDCHFKGITHSSDRCVRCHFYFRTPNSRRSMC